MSPQLLNSIEPDPNPGAIPSYCNLAGGSRTGQCLAGTARAVSDNTGTTVITGTITLQVIYYGTLSNISRGWNFEAKAYVQGTTGKLVSGTRMTMNGICTNGCQAAADTTTAPVVEGQYLTNRTAIGSEAGAEDTSSSQLLRMTFIHPTVTGIAPITTPSLGEVRCDSGATLGGNATPGCVYPAVVPTFALNGTAAPVSPQHAVFVAAAQQSLSDHWGQPGSGKPLHRLADRNKIAANRTKACRGFVSNGGDDSCDEYPFASTYESSTYGGTSRAATDHVPNLDNNAGGSKLAAFNRLHRVLDNDAYYVEVTN